MMKALRILLYAAVAVVLLVVLHAAAVLTGGPAVARWLSETLAFATAAAILLAFYFLPLFVAWRLGVARLRGVAILNAALGWSVIGWILAMYHACTAPRREERQDLLPSLDR